MNERSLLKSKKSNIYWESNNGRCCVHNIVIGLVICCEQKINKKLNLEWTEYVFYCIKTDIICVYTAHYIGSGNQKCSHIK